MGICPDTFHLEYNTLSNQEIISLRVECLSDSGFIFLWVINSQLQFGIQCLEKWGYIMVDKVRFLL